MVAIPAETMLLKIETAIENQTIADPLRPYFGISGIGASCARQLWYNFRWVTARTLSPRERRLLNRGHQEEPIVIADLRAAGCRVHRRQQTMVTGHGHIKGHSDGTVTNVPDAPKTEHLLEIKTANEKNFAQMKKQGIQVAKPEYYAQTQCYMKELKLKRTLFIVANKNNDARYYERLRYDKEVAEKYFSRANDIILSEFPLVKIGGATWFECKWCNHYLVCHFGEAPAVNCRTCHHLDMHPGGRWRCALHREPRSTARQRAGCPDWLLLKGLKND